MNTYTVTFTEPSGKIWTATVQAESRDGAVKIVMDQYPWADNVAPRPTK